MSNNQLMERIRAQEQALKFATFRDDDAWHMGLWLREKFIERQIPVFAEVFVNGGVRFAAASPKSHNNLAEWVRRKRNLALRMGQSSYLTALAFKEWGGSLEAFGMNQTDYGLGAGAFPIAVNDIGLIGCVTVSGLRDMDDHNLVVECLADVLGQNFDTLKLSQQGGNP